MKVKSFSHVRLFAAWTVAYQASLSMGFSRQEYWSGLPFPSPGDLPNPGIEPGSPKLQADSLPSEQNTNCLLNEKWEKLTIEPIHLALTVSITSRPFAKIECRINHK